MKALLALVAHSLYRRRWLLLAECVVLVLFQVLAIAAAGEVQRSNGFGAFAVLMPAFMREWAGVMMSSFGALALVPYSHPIVILLLVATAITIATELTEEAETRFVDIVMARPVARVTPVTRSALVLLIAAVCCVGSMLLGTWIGMATLKPDDATGPALTTVLSLAAGLVMVVLAWGSIALTIASLSVRRSSAGGIAGILAAAMFIVALLGEFWNAAKPWAHVSPFWYHRASPIIAGGSLPWADIGVLAVIALTGFVVARISYARRDL